MTQLTLDPTLYLDEIVLYIKEKYTLDVNPSTVSRLLKAKGLSKKVIGHLPLCSSASAFYRNLLTIVTAAKVSS
jgi:hypothetical protein